MKEARVIRKNDARDFMEGDEHCKLYLETEKIVFGVSTLLPRKGGSTDPGHKDAYEVFYVAKGKVRCNFPDENVSEELAEGDAILIPPNRPHALVNIGAKKTIVIWSQARL